MDSISFPNLNITFEHVGRSFTVFGFSIAYYGLIIGLSILLCVWICMRDAKKAGENPDHILDLVLYGVIAGIAGARLYYVLFRWSDYKDNLLSILNLRQGGLAIYGGVIGAVLTIYFYTKKKGLSFRKYCDLVMGCFILGQVFGRWGNFFNREVFGEYTDSLFAMRLPVKAVNPADISQLMRDHMQVIDGIEFIQVHPTFLYESAWNLLVFLFIRWYIPRKKFDGEIILIYLGGYGIGRFIIEGIRTDQLLLFNTGIPVSQLLSAVLVVVSVCLIFYFRKKQVLDTRN